MSWFIGKSQKHNGPNYIRNDIPKTSVMNVKHIVLAYRWKFLFTLLLLLAESAAMLLFPLFIGYAIEDAINGSFAGSIQLGTLGLMTLAIGAARRFFDTRMYAVAFKSFGAQLMARIEKGPSVKTARLGMLREVVEFLENSLPEIIQSVISFFGVMAILATLNTKVFLGSLFVSFAVFLIYFVSSKRTVLFNKNYNEAVEDQVDVIHSAQPKKMDAHLDNLMQWNIKLSDLETVNFSLSWLILMVFLVGSILLAVNDGLVQYGALFSLVMYVFQFMQSIEGLPFFYQQWLRLTEIKNRLEKLD
ncbi:MAG: ABC transporter six-transmembrane domain-containing protein [Bacteroidota bacterium]